MIKQPIICMIKQHLFLAGIIIKYDVYLLSKTAHHLHDKTAHHLHDKTAPI
jgi:hypothetical protein